MMEDPRTIEPALDLMLISRHLERVGDHATNIAEDVIFIVAARTCGIMATVQSSRPDLQVSFSRPDLQVGRVHVHPRSAPWKVGLHHKRAEDPRVLRIVDVEKHLVGDLDVEHRLAARVNHGSGTRAGAHATQFIEHGPCEHHRMAVCAIVCRARNRWPHTPEDLRAPRLLSRA